MGKGKDHGFTFVLVNVEMPTNPQRTGIRVADMKLEFRRETEHINSRIVGRKCMYSHRMDGIIKCLCLHRGKEKPKTES